MNLAKRVHDAIMRHRMIQPGDGVLLGISGGPDSVALLHLLDELKRSLDCTLAVAHFDHGIRAEEAREDAVFTQALAARLGVPFYLGGKDLVPGETSPSGNLEAKAREARYRFLESVAARIGMTKLAVGHTQDDQVETLLMWLLRGCGPSGLGGMPPVRPIYGAASGNTGSLLIRPLLDVPRVDIMRYLEERGLRFRVDSTNTDTRYLRNWIRSDLLPVLMERTDEHLKHRLARLSALMRSDEFLLAEVVDGVSGGIIHEGVLARGDFLQLEPGLRLRLLRCWLRDHLGDLRGIGFQHVDSVLRLIAAERPSGHVLLPGNWTAVRDYDCVHLIHGFAHRRTEPYSYEFPLEGELELPELAVSMKAWCSSRVEALAPQNLFEAIFDRAAIEGTPELRNRRPGDRFRPIGMVGNKKVKDLFIEKKIPRALRDRLPLLLLGDRVLWIPGFARSNHAKVDVCTRDVWNVAMPAVDLGRSRLVEVD